MKFSRPLLLAFSATTATARTTTTTSASLSRRACAFTVLQKKATVRPMALPIHRPSSFAATTPFPSSFPSSSILFSSATSSTGSSKTDTGLHLPEFESKEEYLSYLASTSKLPKGFASGTAKGTFVSVEAPALGNLPIRGTVIYLTEGPTDSWAAVFTKNKFPGSPIKVGRSRLAGGGPLHALVINNKVSNVCSGGDGEANAEKVCEAVAKALNLPGGAKTVLPSSTGVIGWRLPAEELARDVVPKAVEALQSESALNAAQAIMTTDRYPKVRSKTLSNGARVVGIAKGAGMIEPNMATMLCYIMTDASIGRETAQSMLTDAVDQSFNSITVDGSESTSDTVVLIASNQVPMSSSTDEITEFKEALFEVCQGLSADVVRNGEGTGHVLRIAVENYPGSDYDARQLGRFVANSPLFKCAVSGNDPNTGRLASAIGSFLGRFNEAGSSQDLKITLGGRVIFSKGKFVLEGDEVEKALSGHMKDAQLGEHDEFPKHQKYVEITVDFGISGGAGKATVIGSDLTAEYVAVNADYRS